MKKLICVLLLLLLSAVPALADDAEARSAIEDAMEVYAWFTIAPLDINDDVPSPDGTMYRVLDETLSDPDILQRYLDFYFSTEISLSLWDWQSYQAIDGVLYGYYPGENPLERPIDPDISEINYDLVSEDENTRTYEAVVNCLSSDEPIVYEFVQQNIDGQWIFTEFPFFL